MKKLRVGIIGCGGIANQKHLPALAKNSEQCEVVAFCDIIIERAEEAMKKYGSKDAKVYTDYNELIKRQIH
jgi:predicted dehydrogenase